MNSFLKVSTLASLLAAAALTAQADPTFSGSTSGQFTNPVGGSDNPTPVYTGIGTSSITWGDGTDHNVVTFTPSAPFSSVAADQVFDVGSLYYYNGTVSLGTSLDSVTLALALNFTDPSGLTESFNFPLTITTTPNSGTQDQNADYITLPSSTSDSFDLNGNTYTLKLNFGQFTGGGYLDTTDDTFHVFEDGSATAPIEGEITTNLNGGFSAPDGASTVALLGLATLAMAAVRSRRR